LQLRDGAACELQKCTIGTPAAQQQSIKNERLIMRSKQLYRL
jgi:hypothetical protein